MTQLESLQASLVQTGVVEGNAPSTPEEHRAVRVLLHVARAQAAASTDQTVTQATYLGQALLDAAYDTRWRRSYRVLEVLNAGGRGAEILREFADALQATLAEIRAGRDPQLPDIPEQELLDPFAATKPHRRVSGRHRRTEERSRERRGLGGPVESADQALVRGAEAEIVNEILAGGAVAASFTAAASVAKAKIEATTERRKNDLDAETERLRITSQERIAHLQPRFQAPVFPSDTEDSDGAESGGA